MSFHQRIVKKQFPIQSIKKYYDNQDVQTKLEDIKNKISTSSGEPIDSPYITTKGISSLIAEFIIFQEKFMGVEAPKSERKFTKLPTKLFHDYSATGSLYVILSTCFLFKVAQEWRKFDFLNPTKKEKNFELFSAIESELQKGGYLKKLSVYISSRILSRHQEELKKIARNHGAVVVSAPSKATHIVVPQKPTPEGEMDLDYLRTIEKTGDSCLVHWWYYPDSYDNWIAASEVQGEAEPDQPNPGQWVVTSRWLTDTDFFNEWMNEIDYEVEEAEKIQAIAEDDQDDGPRIISAPSSVRRDKIGKNKPKKRGRESESEEDEYSDESDEEEGFGDFKPRRGGSEASSNKKRKPNVRGSDSRSSRPHKEEIDRGGKKQKVEVKSTPKSDSKKHETPKDSLKTPKVTVRPLSTPGSTPPGETPKEGETPKDSKQGETPATPSSTGSFMPSSTPLLSGGRNPLKPRPFKAILKPGMGGSQRPLGSPLKQSMKDSSASMKSKKAKAKDAPQIIPTPVFKPSGPPLSIANISNLPPMPTVNLITPALGENGELNFPPQASWFKMT